MIATSTPNRPVMERNASKRSLLKARSLSRRFLRTLSQMLDEETDNESSSECEDGQREERNKIVDTDQSNPALNRRASMRNLALTRSLSRRLVQTISQFVEHQDDEEGDFQKKECSEDNVLKDQSPQEERPKLLSRSLSKKLIRTISNLFEDESVEHSLDIFGEVSSRSIESTPTAIDVPKWTGIGEVESGDGFEKFMVSLMKNESFHNSLNDWMGSLSDVFDSNKKACGTRLTAQDHEAMETNVKRMNELGQYLRQSLSCRNLLETVNEDTTRLNSNRRRNFQRSKSCRERKSALSGVAEIDLEDTPSIIISASPDEVLAPETTSETESVPRTTTLVQSENDEDILSVLTEEDAHWMWRGQESPPRSTTTLHNATPPIRLPSPVKSPTKKLSTSLSTDFIQNAVPPVRLPSPTKSPRKMNLQMVNDSVKNCGAIPFLASPL